MERFSVNNKIDSKDRTLAALDSSPLLLEYWSKNHVKCPKSLIGDLQFSFVCFILGEHYLSFEHWLDLVCLILRAKKAFEILDGILKDFLVMLKTQLESLPQDIFAECPMSDNRLVAACQTFEQNWPNDEFKELFVLYKKIIDEIASKF